MLSRFLPNKSFSRHLLHFFLCCLQFGKLRSLFEEERAKLAEAAEAQEDLDEFKERVSHDLAQVVVKYKILSVLNGLSSKSKL